jgi:hypothetical protein
VIVCVGAVFGVVTGVDGGGFGASTTSTSGSDGGAGACTFLGFARSQPGNANTDANNAVFAIPVNFDFFSIVSSIQDYFSLRPLRLEKKTR